MFSKQKIALITGITGQDGSYLADLLIEKKYKVYGIERRLSSKNRNNISGIIDKITLIPGDLADQNSILRALEISNPDEVYNCAAQSFVKESWDAPESTANITGLGVLRELDAIRQFNKNIKFVQFSSSEMFGKIEILPANEQTPFHPRSPYGVSKVFGHFITQNYRESYGMFCCSAIMFNHESPRRGHEFVTRKITDGVVKIYLGLSDKIILGNLDAKRDWGYSPDFMKAIWLILQQNNPDDYVIATGKCYSIRDFLTVAFECVGITNWQEKNLVQQDSKFMRPAEVDILVGNYNKAKNILKWEPETNFYDMVNKMIQNDISILSCQK
ncbi:MAG: GDP-mannose 4,6-dehydratase [bacterium]|nr:GDP-mannose 4,6-dehydratase [bacterium]